MIGNGNIPLPETHGIHMTRGIVQIKEAEVIGQEAEVIGLFVFDDAEPMAKQVDEEATRAEGAGEKARIQFLLNSP